MDILKYFYEEPAALEGVGSPTKAGLTPLDALFGGPMVYRGYLAGTHVPDGPDDALRIGATALAEPRIWTRPLLALFDGAVWSACSASGKIALVEAPEARLSRLADVRAVAVAEESFDTGLLGKASARREDRPALLALLAQVRAVVFPEPAHDGYDLHLFSAQPLHAPFVEALRRHPAPAARRFVLPYQRARGEHRFYFEQWQLDTLPDFAEEV